jgi:hypothetical protein
MKSVSLLHLLHCGSHRQSSSITLAHNIDTLVIEGKGSATCTLPVQKLLATVGIDLLQTDQATCHPHWDQKHRLTLYPQYVALLVCESLLFKVRVSREPAPVQHAYCALYGYLLLLAPIILCFADR